MWSKLKGSAIDIGVFLVEVILQKNRLAMDVINCLIAACCWQNIHAVPQHGAVFEIRVVHGYGAHWSKDGTKFISLKEMEALVCLRGHFDWHP